MGIFDVRRMGAKGDGSRDDTAAIQSAIDSAAADEGGVVFFPKGRYRITRSLIKKRAVSLEGEGSVGEAWSDLNGSVLIWGSAKSGTMIDTTNESLHGTFIRNLKFFRGVPYDPKTGEPLVTGILGGSSLCGGGASAFPFTRI